MSKGSRKREAAALRRVEEEKIRQQNHKRHIRMGIISGAVAIVCAAAIVVGAFAISRTLKMKDPDYAQHHTYVVTSDNYKVSQAAMTYFINLTAGNFTSQNQGNLETLGLDTSKSLKEQQCYYDETKTWFSYFADQSLNYVKWMVAFAEQARVDGRSLTEENQASIEETMKTVNPANFGEYLTKDDIRGALELYYLAMQQEDEVQKQMIAEDADVQKYYDEHTNQFVKADYSCYFISYTEGADHSEQEAAALKDALAAAKSADEFAELVKKDLIATGVATAETADSIFNASYHVTGCRYDETDNASKWLFGGAKVGETFVDSGEYNYTVYMCTAEPARDESTTIDVRHVLLTANKYGSDEAASNKANELLAKWKDGEATEESFGEIAKEFSEDGNAADGGIYKGVTPGQMVDTFNDWCFDPARQPGDTGIVKTTYGYHLMYFVATGDPIWYRDAHEAYLDDLYKSRQDACAAAYHVKTNEDALNTIDM